MKNITISRINKGNRGVEKAINVPGTTLLVSEWLDPETRRFERLVLLMKCLLISHLLAVLFL